MTHSIPLALLGAHYLPYACLALAVLLVRLSMGKFRRGERLLLLVFVVLVALEFAQLSVHRLHYAIDGDVMGLSRYFGVLSPLLWIFAAKGLAWAWGDRRGWWRTTLRAVFGLGLVCALLAANLGKIVAYLSSGTALDTAVAVERIVPVIRADYLGPDRQPVIRRAPYEYYTGRRPLVSGPFGAAGWALRGDSCGVTGGKCPYPEDYLFFPLDCGYCGITNVDARVYTCVTKVRGGEGTTWGLFRRRTVPGRSP